MTAAHKLCAPLTLVADAVDDTADLDVEWRSQTVIDQYSPEHQFVGALMWLCGRLHNYSDVIRSHTSITVT